jgi:hypothetical protein
LEVNSPTTKRARRDRSFLGRRLISSCIFVSCRTGCHDIERLLFFPLLFFFLGHLFSKIPQAIGFCSTIMLDYLSEHILLLFIGTHILAHDLKLRAGLGSVGGVIACTSKLYHQPSDLPLAALCSLLLPQSGTFLSPLVFLCFCIWFLTRCIALCCVGQRLEL